MSLKQAEFRVNYEILSGVRFRITKAGALQNGVRFGDSLKICATNLYETQNSNALFAEAKEVNAVFKISCKSEEQAIAVGNYIHSYLLKNNKMILQGDMPILTNGTYNINIDFDFSLIEKTIRSEK